MIKDYYKRIEPPDAVADRHAHAHTATRARARTHTRRHHHHRDPSRSPLATALHTAACEQVLLHRVAPFPVLSKEEQPARYA